MASRHRSWSKAPISIVFVLMVFALPSGCETQKKLYERPDLPKSELSTVSAPNHKVSLSHVGGGETGSAVDVVQVLPGHHSFVLQRGLGILAPRTGIIAITTTAGHDYELEYEGWFIWAIDTTTGEIVAGHKPSEDKAPAE